MALRIAVDENHGHGGVAAPIEGVLAPLVRAEVRLQAGAQVVGERDQGAP
jgi:hypothetical protein